MRERLQVFLVAMGIVSIFSSIVWTFVVPGDRWLWWSRWSLAVICGGFLYVGECIKGNKSG